MENITLCGDNNLGPRVADCRGDFDFTLLFEEYFMSIAPSVLLLLALPSRYRQLCKKKTKEVAKSPVYWAKLVTTRLCHISKTALLSLKTNMNMVALCPNVRAVSTIASHTLGIASYAANTSITSSSGDGAHSICWVAVTITLGASIFYSPFSSAKSLLVLVLAVRHCTCADAMARALHDHIHSLHSWYLAKASMVLS